MKSPKVLSLISRRKFYSSAFPSDWSNPKRVSHELDVPPIATVSDSKSIFNLKFVNICNSIQEYLTKILKSQVYEIANETPLTFASMLSNELNNQVESEFLLLSNILNLI